MRLDLDLGLVVYRGRVVVVVVVAVVVVVVVSWKEGTMVDGSDFTSAGEGKVACRFGNASWADSAGPALLFRKCN